jgi:hypothetical protein
MDTRRGHIRWLQKRQVVAETMLGRRIDDVSLLSLVHGCCPPRLAVAALAAALSMPGCGKQDTPAQAPASAPTTIAVPAPPTATPTPVTTPAPVATAPAATAPSSAAAPITTGALIQDHETGVEVTLLEARRTAGDSVTVKWRYRNTLSNGVKILQGGSSWSEVYKLTMGAFFIDPVNKKKYLVITDAENIPLSSKHGDWQGYTLAPGQTLGSWARFPAPPANVDKITITLPGVPPFEDVAIVK